MSTVQGHLKTKWQQASGFNNTNVSCWGSWRLWWFLACSYNCTNWVIGMLDLDLCKQSYVIYLCLMFTFCNFSCVAGCLWARTVGDSTTPTGLDQKCVCWGTVFKEHWALCHLYVCVYIHVYCCTFGDAEWPISQMKIYRGIVSKSTRTQTILDNTWFQDQLLFLVESAV